MSLLIYWEHRFVFGAFLNISFIHPPMPSSLGESIDSAGILNRGIVIHLENGLMVGVVSEADIFDAYLATQSRVYDLEHG